MSPFLGAGALDDMIDSHQGATRRAAERIAEAGTDRLERNVKRRTPVDTSPFRNKPDRPRGTLKRSVHRVEGLRLTTRGGVVTFTGEVVTYDPVAPYVEEDTPPHIIRPKTPGGRLRFQAADGFTGRDGVYYPPGTWVSVEEVHHPGTTGQHMFSLGALDTEAQTDDLAHEPLARWKREVESVHV